MQDKTPGTYIIDDIQEIGKAKRIETYVLLCYTLKEEIVRSK